MYKITIESLSTINSLIDRTEKIRANSWGIDKKYKLKNSFHHSPYLEIHNLIYYEDTEPKNDIQLMDYLIKIKNSIYLCNQAINRLEFSYKKEFNEPIKLQTISMICITKEYLSFLTETSSIAYDYLIKNQYL